MCASVFFFSGFLSFLLISEYIRIFASDSRRSEVHFSLVVRNEKKWFGFYSRFYQRVLGVLNAGEEKKYYIYGNTAKHIKMVLMRSLLLSCSIRIGERNREP